jgi:hypothetical protein
MHAVETLNIRPNRHINIYQDIIEIDKEYAFESIHRKFEFEFE